MNPNEIQPQYNGDQDMGSAEQMASHNQHIQRKTPVKRRHQEIEVRKIINFDFSKKRI